MSGRNKIVLAGGSGSIGRYLKQRLSRDYQVVILSRKPSNGEVFWDGQTLGEWTSELEGTLAVINLSGASIEKRHTSKYKEQIIQSRVLPTKILCEAIGQLNIPVAKWINASGIGIYGNSGQLKNESGALGDDFVAEVCKKWEREIDVCSCGQTKKYVLRIAPVLMQSAGLLKPLIATTKLGLGGKMGSGNNYMSWVHIQDICAIVEACLTDVLSPGIMNAVAPQAVTNKEFMSTLRKTWNVPFGLPSPEFAIKLGALAQGMEPSLIFSNQRIHSSVIPEDLFQFQALDAALQNLKGTE